jgi:hypothetical protein
VKSPRNILIGVLCAALLATGALAWYQFRELIVLKAQLADGDNVSLRKQLAAARKTIKSLEDRIAALRGRRGGGDGSLADGGDGSDNPSQNGAGRRGRFGAWGEMANNPEFQRLLAIQMKGRISQTYGPLFKSLNLSPDQLAQFQSLLADKQQALMDVMAAARDQGINPRTDPDAFKTLVGQAVSQADANIQQALGDAAFQQYQQYQQTLPERNTVNSLQQQLSYSQTPLTDDEANQMISLLAQNQPQRAGNGTAGTGNGGDAGPNPMSLVNGGGTARVTNDAITQASGVLSAPQVAALQQIQLQQQAQQQMQQLMRSANQGSGGAAAPSGSAPSGGSGGGGKG